MKKGKQLELNTQLLENEIRQQTEALHRISKWIKYALALTTIGIVLVYFGFTQENFSLPLKIAGFVIATIGLVIAIVFGYAHRNGHKNVNRMIDVLEKQLKKTKKKKKK